MTPLHSLAPAAALLTVLALTACTPPVKTTTTAHPTSTSATSPAPSATSGAGQSTATAIPIDPSILFTISATVTLGTGEVGHVVQTVYKPVGSAPDQGAVEALLDEECGGWRTEYPAVEYVHATITATTDGSSAWANHWVAVSMSGGPVYIGPAFFGDFGSFQAPCNTVRVVLPGTIEGYTPVPAGGSPDATGGWATIFYGFGIVNAPDHPDTPQPGDTVLSDCVIALGADALATSAIAPQWPAAPQAYPGFTCEVNR